MTHDQADELRNLVRSHGRPSPPTLAPPQMIAITGGQRGVGATTVALNLATAFVLEGRRAILVDADLDRGDIAPRCGIAERASIVDILSGRHTIHEVLTRGPAGMSLLPGTWAPSEGSDCSATAQGRLISQLQGLGTHADVVIVDTGSQRSGFVRRFWQAADGVLVVSTTEPAAIMDCYATIKVLLAGDASVAVKTLINRAPDAARAAELHARIADACRRFLGVRATAAGYLESDPLVDEATRLATPLLLSAPQSSLARSLEHLAAELSLVRRASTAERLVSARRPSALGVTSAA